MACVHQLMTGLMHSLCATTKKRPQQEPQMSSSHQFCPFSILNKVHYTTWHDSTENDWRNTTAKASGSKDTRWSMKKGDPRTILPLSIPSFEQSTFCANPAYLHTSDLRVMDTLPHTVLMMWLFALNFKRMLCCFPCNRFCLFYLRTENIPYS